MVVDSVLCHSPT